MRNPNGATAARIVEADDFVDQILKNRIQSVPGEFEMPVERGLRPAPFQVGDNPVQQYPDTVDDRFTMADLLMRKRSKAERWTEKSKQQASQIFSLLARFMKEERALENMSAVKQKDLPLSRASWRPQSTSIMERVRTMKNR